MKQECKVFKVPEQAVVKGLKLNGDTYSGVISQSEAGKAWWEKHIYEDAYKQQ